MAVDAESTQITPAELADLIRSGDPVTILDVRWRLDEPDGRSAYLRGHLPGAVYVSLEEELSDHTITGRGRHPLPSGRRLEAAARRWGIRQASPAVAYDDWNRVGSSRAWWVLTAAGLPDVRILDGGLSAWQSAGGPLDTGDVAPPRGDVTVLHSDLYLGARSTLTARQAAAGDLSGRPLGVYCGSGVSATVVVAALIAAGRDAALFPGSWSEWSSDPAHAVARGPGAP